MKKLLKTIERVGVVANTGKDSCRAPAQAAARLIRKSGRTLLTETATAGFAGLKAQTFPNVGSLAAASDLLVVLGGDGTILRIARETARAHCPMLGINLGKLGFLTAAPSRQLAAALRQVWQGRFTVENRPMIEATGSGPNQATPQLALNDFVISRGATSRMIDLEVSVDDRVLTQYRCDGLIVCSPTGSTAYSLSAGGAIVSPDAPVFTITPICPHTLTNRSVVVSLNSVVRVKVISSRLQVLLAADGQAESHLHSDDTVTIRRSRHAIRLVHLAGSSFFKTLRHKLNWRGSHVDENLSPAP